MESEPTLTILDNYMASENYAKKVDWYIEQYMDDGTYTLDDIEGILETMSANSIQYILQLFQNSK
jgi:hypothetical protein